MVSSESLLQWQYYTELFEMLVVTIAVIGRSHAVQVASSVFFGVVRPYLVRRDARTKGRDRIHLQIQYAITTLGTRNQDKP